MRGEFRFRLFVRRRCSAEQRQSLLRDGELLSACCESAHEMFESSAAGPLTDFLEWLMDHADEIFALIARIISLFAGLPGAAPA